MAEEAVTEAPIKQPAANDLGEYIRDIAPYSEEQDKRITAFYKKKGRFGKLFTYNKTGNLVVYNKDGIKLGTVAATMIDKSSGRAIYAVMSFGGILGIVVFLATRGVGA
jgi:hypothetical protein